MNPSKHPYSTLAMLLLLAGAAPPAFGSNIFVAPTVSDPPISMLELEAELMQLDPADFYALSEQSPFLNAGNQHLYSNLEQLILTLGGNQQMIAELFEQGGVFSGGAGGAGGGGGAGAQVVLSGASAQSSSTPEPDTMGLLGGTLLFLCLYAAWRLRGGAAAQPPEANQNARTDETTPENPADPAAASGVAH